MTDRERGVPSDGTTDAADQEADFVAWAERQVALLREGEFCEPPEVQDLDFIP